MSDHLGGHYGFTAMCLPTLDYIKEKFDIKSMIDVGCGPAGMTEYANYIGIYGIGIDGDTSLGEKPYVKLHDYVTGPLELNETFDLAYSTEFLEHVEEEFLSNFMPTFQKAQYAFISAAPPGQGGHHHVNEKNKEYWIEKFAEYGFEHLPEASDEISKTFPEWKLITNNSLFFKNKTDIQVTPNRTCFEIDYDHLVAISNKVFEGLGNKIIKK
jgi:hypothetical protein